MALERSFKGVFVPLSFWERKDLFWNDKIFLIEADSRYGLNEKFWAADVIEALDFNERNNTLLMRLSELGFVKLYGSGEVELIKSLK
ncbi:hypothetical protein [Leeuwenhoekiella sp. LLG6367-2.1]|uniref:hypothetical protein n=1 Tax=Leeuwenhoekiella sp. LLG6367-2.1 TaxID=3160833 RepID=UPI0038636A2B